MNRQGFLNINLQGSLLIAFAIAVLVPLLIFATLSYSNAAALSLQNLEAYIAATGARRQEAVENDFRNALNIVNNFLDSVSNREILVEPLVIRRELGTSVNFAIENAVENLFRDQLISTDYFNSVWLLTPGRDETGQDATAFATVTAPNQTLPFSRILQQESESDIFRVGRSLIESQTRNGRLVIEDTQALVVTQRADGTQHIEIINLLFEEIDGQAELVGYLVVDLNLERIMLDNLGEQIGNLATYAYVLMPVAGEVYVAPSNVIEENLVDTKSTGAQRILNGEPSGVETYRVGAEANRREVIGYYAPIIIEDQRFSLVTEIETSIVQEQLLTYITSVSFPVILGAVLFLLIIAILLNLLITPPLLQLRNALRGIIRGNFEVPVTSINRGDEIGLLSIAFVDMREQIRSLTADMERRLRIRTRDVRVTQDISRTVTAERDLSKLMSQAVNLIVENFPTVYHAQIFLIDEAQQFAILRASTGEAGKQLLQRGHKLAVGSVSVIGQVTEQGQVIVARDTAESDVHRRNEFLQETRAEVAIPLRLGETIVGALDVQSKQRDSFDEDQVNALQTLADQITIAIENARLYGETARLLADLERDRRANTRQSWQQYLYSQRTGSLIRRAGVETGYNFNPLAGTVYRTGKAAIGESTERKTIPFAVPITLRGQILGVAEYEVPESDFSYDRVLLAQELVNRLAISLDNARLFQDSQQATERERIVNEISTKLTGQTDVEAILQTAIREVSLALNTSQVAIRLHSANGTEQDPISKTPVIDN